jgi:hypothetical protein
VAISLPRRSRKLGRAKPPVSLRPRIRCGRGNPLVATISGPALCPVKLLSADAQVPSDPVHGSRGEIPIAVSGNCGFPVVGRVDPDFVRSASLTMKGASQASQFPGQFPVGHTAMEMRPLPVWDRTIPSGNGLPRSL